MKKNGGWVESVLVGGVFLSSIFAAGFMTLKSWSIAASTIASSSILEGCLAGFGCFSMLLGFYGAREAQKTMMRLQRHHRCVYHRWARLCLERMCCATLAGTVGGAILLGSLYKMLIIGHQ